MIKPITFQCYHLSCGVNICKSERRNIAVFKYFNVEICIFLNKEFKHFDGVFVKCLLMQFSDKKQLNGYLSNKVMNKYQHLF
jgi:hypothetical protein